MLLHLLVCASAVPSARMAFPILMLHLRDQVSQEGFLAVGLHAPPLHTCSALCVTQL